MQGDPIFQIYTMKTELYLKEYVSPARYMGQWLYRIHGCTIEELQASNRELCFRCTDVLIAVLQITCTESFKLLSTKHLSKWFPRILSIRFLGHHRVS
jgi:hypothetical protein